MAALRNLDVARADQSDRRSARPPSRAGAVSLRAERNFGQRKRPAAVTRAVANAKAGDTRAIRYLCARYETDVDRFVQSMIRDDLTAERVRRELRIRLPRLIHMYEPREAPFPSWLLRMTRDITIEHLARKRSSRCEDTTHLPGADVVVLRPIDHASEGGEDGDAPGTRRSTASTRVRARS